MANLMLEVESSDDDDRDKVLEFLLQSAELLKIFLPEVQISVSDGFGTTKDY